MNPIDHSEKLQFVIDQLRSYNGQKKELSGSTFVLCPFHAERTPSGQIFHGPNTYSPGFFLCRGCGRKAIWDEVAPVIGLLPFGKPKPNEDAFSIGLNTLEDTKKDFKYVLEPLPKNKVWRSIKTNLLRSIGCKLMITDWGDRYVYLPVYIGGTLRGWVRSRIKKDPNNELPSHLNKRGVWSKRYGLFPFDYSIQIMKSLASDTIVLVEGPRDALRLISYGIPAMSILGTTSWTERKAQLLEIHDVKTVLLMMDGDDPGIKATDTATEYLSPLLKVKNIRLWKMSGNPYPAYKEETDPFLADKMKSKLWDPGNCPERILKHIKQKYF